MMKNIRKWIEIPLIVLLAFSIIYVLMLYLGIPIDLNTDQITITDISVPFNGILSPLIAIVAAILVYVAFRAQVEANKKLTELQEKTTKFEYARQLNESISIIVETQNNHETFIMDAYNKFLESQTDETHITYKIKKRAIKKHTNKIFSSSSIIYIIDSFSECQIGGSYCIPLHAMIDIYIKNSITYMGKILSFCHLIDIKDISRMGGFAIWMKIEAAISEINTSYQTIEITEQYKTAIMKNENWKKYIEEIDQLYREIVIVKATHYATLNFRLL